MCKSCRREYLRDFRTRSAAKVHNHLTGTEMSHTNEWAVDAYFLLIFAIRLWLVDFQCYGNLF